MKQSAVEYLEEQLKNRLPTNLFIGVVIEDVFEHAKEMEKQQQGYSKKEVEKLIREYALDFEDKIESIELNNWIAKQFKKE